MKATIYWHKRLNPVSTAKIKKRFHIAGITVNGLSTAIIDTDDEELFRECLKRDLFRLRGKITYE